MTIDDIITRLEKSEAPDRELDGDILEFTGGCAHRETEYYCIEDGNDVDSGFTCKRCGKDTYGQRVPHYTGSVDAALALFEQRLPWCGRSMSKGRTRPDEPLYGCQIYASDYAPKEEDMVVISEAEHDVEAICLCLAILKALPERAP